MNRLNDKLIEKLKQFQNYMDGQIQIKLANWLTNIILKNGI
jgi:hypothetical protein